jgi:hypothetical protein
MKHKHFPIYIVYGRRSSDTQRGNSSEERQLDIEHYRGRAVELGLRFREVPYFDDAKSGFFGDNLEAELGKIFDDVQTGALPKGSIIGTESHSRLGRLKPGEALMQYLRILELGIKLDIKGKALRSWASINGLMGIGILSEDFIEMYMAYKHSADLQRVERETNRIKRKAVREGRQGGTMKKGGAGWFVGHRCPAWLVPRDRPEIWREDGKPYLYGVDEEMARIIRMIFDWAEAGVGTVRIERRLNDMKFAPLGNHHRKNSEKMIAGWSAGMVGALLKNIAVIGLWQPQTRIREREIEDASGETTTERLRYSMKVKDGEAIPYYPPIITPGQFARVGDGLRKRDRVDDSKAFARGGRTGRGFGNIIKGLATCECCGGTVTLWSRSADPKNPRRGGPMKYLRCDNARRSVVLPHGSKCQNVHGYRYAAFESVLFDQLLSPKLIPVLRDMLPHSHGDDLLDRRIADVEAKIDDANQQIERLVRRAIKTEDDDIAAQYESEAKTIRVGRDKVLSERDRLYAQRISQSERIEGKIAEIIALLRETTDMQAREDARTNLNSLLARYAKFVLTEDYRMKVRIIGHSGLMPVEATMSVAEGLIGIKVLDREGEVLTDYQRAGLALLEPMEAA